MSGYFLDETRKRLGPDPNADLNTTKYLHGDPDSIDALIEKAKELHQEGFCIHCCSEAVKTAFPVLIGILLGSALATFLIGKIV